MWQVETLLRQSVPVDTLFIHSHDMSLYTVEAEIDGERHPLGDAGRVLSFRCIEQVRQRLASLMVVRCVLVQVSAYQEMVGQAPAAPPMELELSWPGWQAEG
ncbi:MULTISPECIES: DUF6482 family protein [Oceanimonas]|uniref:Uncharacterized protein n=1 Tax=Oceanimonas doudoroffii TaxID=84158 RepID=A0A233RDS6_9GAMM|nr:MULTISPECIES: DUF6482 family protein [Oceanimonas]NHH99094.1 hypothetical protein [Oceanimonas sp. MB9]OXY81545.1 hypothetical protein B6S08_11255 [Oceanimonas doudoroffii]